MRRVALDGLDEPCVITKLLVSETGRRDRVRERPVAMEAGVRVRGRLRVSYRCRTGHLSRLEMVSLGASKRTAVP